MCITISKQYLYLLPIVSGGAWVKTSLLSTIWAYPWQLLWYHLSTSKKKPHAKPFQTPWLIIAEGNWCIEATVVKLVLPWVTAAPGRFRSVISDCMLKSFWHEFRTQSSVYPNFLSVCVAAFPWPRQRNVLFICRTLVLPLWKLGCCVNGLSRMDLVNASLCSDNPSPYDHINVCHYLSKGKYKYFCTFCIMYIYAFLCN